MMGKDNLFFNVLKSYILSDRQAYVLYCKIIYLILRVAICFLVLGGSVEVLLRLIFLLMLM